MLATSPSWNSDAVKEGTKVTKNAKKILGLRPRLWGVGRPDAAIGPDVRHDFKFFFASFASFVSSFNGER